MTSKTWSRQSALDVLREQRRRFADDGRSEALDSLAAVLADRLAEHTDVPPADAATVLLLAGACVGGLAVTHQMPAVMLAEIIQATAVELDRRASGGETS
ncbi:hypothetical protein STRCI_001339 [Streptomyces cinnabarinus]|uniref:MftR C-terminal domain-containing protein n=1 Tax=Streptomyces cinnabarinus TaxID=67287 RepID=A0ABY7K9L5_9ACTN|nr:hypothetical protein [Streptomyces cinnabarinus]WAZ20238.1 hypothetical protein STRCI_001339 [Streptomyces cinnabarinus]